MEFITYDTHHEAHPVNDTTLTRNTLTFTRYAAMAWSMITLLTFSLAMIAIPPSGPYCPSECMVYPYADLLAYYPRDYFWLYSAIIQLFAYLVFVMSTYFIATQDRKLFAFLSTGFALIAATVLLIAYFTQFSVVPISLMKGETNGMLLLTQYNEHGLFIALEELGYLTMSISLLFLAWVFPTNLRLGKFLRYLLMLPVIVTVGAFAFYSWQFGIDRSYRAEVAIITGNWLVTIVAGVAIAFYCKDLAKKTA